METWRAMIKEVGNDFTLKPTWTGSMYEDVVDEAIHDALMCQYLRNFWGLNSPDVEWYTLKKIEPVGLDMTHEQIDRLTQQMMNNDSFLVAVGRAYMDWVDGGINTNDVPPADYIREHYKKFMV